MLPPVLLSQHLLDHELGDENKTINVDGNERAQIVHRVIRKLLREIDAGVVDERVDPAESGYGGIRQLFAAVLGSPMSPSTSARSADAGNGFALVMFREFATTR